MEKHETGLSNNNLADNQPIKAEIAGKSLVIVKHNGNVYALDQLCTHEHGHLDEGYVDGEELICPLHAGAFFIATGKANENTPWATDTVSYKVEVDGSGKIWIYI